MCPECGHRGTAFGLEMDADMEGGKWNCLRCHEFGFIAKGFLYKKGERLDPDHRSVVRRPLFGSAPKTFEPTIPAVAHIYSRIMDVYPGHYPGSPAQAYLRSP